VTISYDIVNFMGMCTSVLLLTVFNCFVRKWMKPLTVLMSVYFIGAVMFTVVLYFFIKHFFTCKPVSVTNSALLPLLGLQHIY